MNEMNEIELMEKETSAVAITSDIKAALTRDLAPVAERMHEYTAYAAIVNVASLEDAERARDVVNRIDRDLKLVKGHEILTKITDGFHKLHRRATAFRSLFVDPMERDKAKIRRAAIDWQESERIKAEDARRRLQAEADMKAAREREALLKKAESLKTPEKQEAYREQAAAVIAPAVSVAAPKSGLRVSNAWKGKSVDGQFFAALATRPDLRGFVEVKTTSMERAKAANPSAEIPGVVFELITR